MKLAAWSITASLLAVPTRARAAPDDTPDVTLRVGAGCEIATGVATAVAAFRARLGLDHVLLRGHHDHRLGLGGTLGVGDFFNDSEPRSGPRHVYAYASGGPEVMYTLDRIGREREAKLFAAVAIVKTSFEYQFKDRTDGWGTRVSLGANWVRSVPRLIDEARPKKCDMGSSGGCGIGEVVTMLLPHQFELSGEHDHGTTRVGVTFGYGY